MSERLYAKIGRQAERIEDLDAAYDHLLALFARVITGEVARSRVLLNLTERTWTLAPEGRSPAGPATINGLPRCVLGAPEPGRAPSGNGHAPLRVEGGVEGLRELSGGED